MVNGQKGMNPSAITIIARNWPRCGSNQQLPVPNPCMQLTELPELGTRDTEMMLCLVSLLPTSIQIHQWLNKGK